MLKKKMYNSNILFYDHTVQSSLWNVINSYNLNLVKYEYIHNVFLRFPIDIKYVLWLNAYNQTVNATFLNSMHFGFNKVHYRLFNFQQTQLLYINNVQ